MEEYIFEYMVDLDVLKTKNSELAKLLSSTQSELGTEKGKVTKLKIELAQSEIQLKRLKNDFKRKEQALKKAQSSRDVATTLFGVLVGMSIKDKEKNTYQNKEIDSTT